MEKFELVQHFIRYLVAQDLPPHITIDLRYPGTCGIPESVKDGSESIVLNVSANATNDTLRIGKYQCQAHMRFKGEPCSVAWHPDAIQTVHSPGSNTPHVIFPVYPDIEIEFESPKKANHLKVVK